MDHKFSKNRKYYTISIYAIGVILISALTILILLNWDKMMGVLGEIADMLMPFIVGAFIAYMLNPLVKFISEKVLKKLFKLNKPKIRLAISIAAAYIIVLGALAIIIVFIIPQVRESIKAFGGFIDSATTGYAKIMKFLDKLHEAYPQLKIEILQEEIEKLPDVFVTTIKEIIPSLVPKVLGTSVSVISGVFDALIAFIVSIYMLFDKSKIINRCKMAIYAVMKKDKATAFLNTLSECNNIFSGFIVGKFIDSVIIGILCFIVCSIFRVPAAVIISIVVGVTNMIPYFGPFIGAIPSIILLLFIDFGYAVFFAIFVLILQQFDGLYLGPKILGESTGLRPLWVIFAITVGGVIAGPVGMFLGVPTVAVISHLSEKFIQGRLKKKAIEFKKNDETGIIEIDERSKNEESMEE